MTDSQTPSDLNGEASLDTTHSSDARTYRASTLDEAVALARGELGPEVELVQASRVRRGGLGGFFATDLGVEVLVRRRSPGATVTAGGAATDAAAEFAQALAAADQELAAADHELAAADHEMAVVADASQPEMAMAGAHDPSVAEAEMAMAGAHDPSVAEASMAGEAQGPPASVVSHPSGGGRTATPDTPPRRPHPADPRSHRIGYHPGPDDLDVAGDLDQQFGQFGELDRRFEPPTGEMYGELPIAEADASVQTALDRLIQHAESIDRPIPPLHAHIDNAERAASVDEDLTPIGTQRPMLPDDDFWNPRATVTAAPVFDDEPVIEVASDELTDLEDHLRAELSGMPTRSEVHSARRTELSEPAHADLADDLADHLADHLADTEWGEGLTDAVESEPDVDLDETTELPSPQLDTDLHTELDTGLDADLDTGLDDRDGDFGGDLDSDPDDPSAAEPVVASRGELAPPSALLNPQLASSPTAVDELDEMLRSVGIEIDVARRGDAAIERLSSTLSMAAEAGLAAPGDLAQLAHDRLVEGVAALSSGRNAPVRMLAVTVTGADGTSVSISTQLADDDYLFEDGPLNGPSLQLVPNCDD